MKKMKMYLMTAMLGVASLSMVFTSCNTDECKDVVCENGGTCNADDGSCTCPIGFEGTNCETYSTTKFAGNYSCTDVCTTGSGTYAASMSLSSNQSSLIITNVGNLGATATATATADGNNFTIARQTVSGTTSTEIEGSGAYNSGVITGSYTVYVGGVVQDNCTFTWTKQ